jgi:hypothetical protein
VPAALARPLTNIFSARCHKPASPTSFQYPAPSDFQNSAPADHPVSGTSSRRKACVIVPRRRYNGADSYPAVRSRRNPVLVGFFKRELVIIAALPLSALA